MAFFDRVTSSVVQRFTRRVGGGGHSTVTTGASADHREIEIENSESSDLSSESTAARTMDRRRQQSGGGKSPTAKSDDWRRRESELNEAYRRKFESARQKWQADKSRETEVLVAGMKKKHDGELETMVKNKEKELKLLRTQLQKAQQHGGGGQPLGRSRSGPLMNSASQDSIKSTKSQDYSHSRARTSAAEQANMRELIAELQTSVKRGECESKRKETELRTMREQHDSEIQRMARDAQRHIKALLEELQLRERRIEKLERQLRTSENQQKLSTIVKDELQNSFRSNSRRSEKSTPPVENTNLQVVDMKLASSSSSSVSTPRLGPFTPNTIPKDDYEKEKQRWQQKMIELEAALKRSEESNADLAQSKAEMIKKNKELEKVKKSLEDFNKRLSERQKTLNQETRLLEQRLKEAQDETIRTTQACDSVTLECNRLKEKRYNPDRDEELERLKQQNLEYCKCIAALKQTILEKDRRLEVLQQKLRRSKRCRATIGGIERSSEDGGGSSVNDPLENFSNSSLLSLDTINEDYGEATKEELELSYRQLANEHVELQNVCSSLMMRQASSDCSSTGADECSQQDLRAKLQEALRKIVQLERANACTAALGVDAAWAQEKLRYASLIRAMGEKIERLESAQERLQQELNTTREENELLEFQVLEMEHSQSEEMSMCSSSMTMSRCNKSQCDRSVSTSEDEGHFSMDQSTDEHSTTKEVPVEELKIRLTLLKHRKELRADERSAIAQVKDVWESLQNEHVQCASKLIEAEMRSRETESQLRGQLEMLQVEKMELSTKNKKKLKAKELQRELENVLETHSKLQEDSGAMKKELDGLRSETAQLRSSYSSCLESEKREQSTSLALRQQLDEMAISRTAEIEILEQASRQHLQNMTAMRMKIADLEKDIDVLNRENRSLTSELTEHRQLSAVANHYDDELERIRRTNEEYHESLAEYKKMESCWNEQRLEIERKYADVKLKFKEAMKLIKEYEQNINKYGERLKEMTMDRDETARLRALHERRIVELEQRIETLDKSTKPSRDDFIAYKEVEEQLKAMLREKSNELEEKCLVERRLADEKAKLQKQLQHVKTYSAQLESQFEMQIQIVQALKTQVLEMQQQKTAHSNESGVRHHLDAAHRMFATLAPRTPADKAFFCCQAASGAAANHQLSYLEDVSLDLWSNIAMTGTSKLDESFDFHKACVKLHSVRSSLTALEHNGAADALGKLCSAMLSYSERLCDLQSKLEDSEKTAVMCKEQVDKANARAEMLQRQCHDALTGVTQTVESTAANSNEERLSDTLDRLYREFKDVVEKARGGDGEVLSDFRTRFAKLVVDTAGDEDTNCVRTVSPTEQCGSGTESDLYDRSPLLSRKRRTVENGAGGGSFRSSSSCEESHGSKTITSTTMRSQLGDDDTSIVLSPPSHVRLAADLRNGRYLVCWTEPETLGAVQGYRVYVKDAVKKYILSPHCTKAVVECTSENEWMSINVRSVSGLAESSGASIDVERSKDFVQNMFPHDSDESNDGEIVRSKSAIHDDATTDDEECSEV